MELIEAALLLDSLDRLTHRVEWTALNGLPCRAIEDALYHGRPEHALQEDNLAHGRRP